MHRSLVFLAWALALLACSSSFASALTVRHTFNVGNLRLNRLCKNQVITAVNGGLPGPTIVAQDGDTLVVRVNNISPYNVTIHWHGVFQLMSAWADGPEYITQCPIRPGQSFTYRFNVTRQEGTLLWHAHFKALRTTVHGALIIRPARGRTYPFPTPFFEIPIVLGEWWNANIMDVEEEAVSTGRPPNMSNALTINGQPGDLYPCSSANTVRFTLVRGKTYLLRIINAALNTPLFFKIANHKFTVVAVDASYTDPYDSDVLVIAPGQTVDALMTADQALRRYYMAASAHVVPPLAPYVNISTTAIVSYLGAAPLSPPLMPAMPGARDSDTAHAFLSNLTGLTSSPHWTPVPLEIEERMFVTVGLGLVPGPCDTPTGVCSGPGGQRLAASMNNVSFELPERLSIMEAYVNNVSGIYTADFPDNPPVTFDYTNPSNQQNPALMGTARGTRVKVFKYNATVEMVFQNTAVLSSDDHPMHLHGLNFYVVAQGFGNYNPQTDAANFNLVNPQERNTVVVPAFGWVVIRFRANNPGVWFVHCHIDAHVPWGLSNAFIIENGPTPDTTLPPPPSDLPKC
ncbi:laccase [Salvia divinorum]|uniref:Laccase n=1 Tax=Salvia divinorum TaxID=28513 RepID=A0ABD1GQ49_SALDI